MPPDHNDRIVNTNRAFAIGVALNIVFVIIEGGFGILAGSLALMADAWHNLSDVLCLLLAWGANLLAARAATENRTYGYRRVTIMASLVSAILLFIAIGGITWEAINRLFEPGPVSGRTVIVIAGIGVIINTITALLFMSGKNRDLNIKAAFMHMAADAGVSLGVVVAGIFILFWGWLWMDPAISLVIAAVILVGTWGLLRDSINYAIDAVPGDIDVPAIKAYLTGLENVSDIHDLHIWPLSTTEIALTVHLVVTDDSLNNNLLRDLQQHMHDHFGIEHSTIQVERSHIENICMLDRKKCNNGN